MSDIIESCGCVFCDMGLEPELIHVVKDKGNVSCLRPADPPAPEQGGDHDDLLSRADEAYKWATAENDHINPELVGELCEALRDAEARIAELEGGLREIEPYLDAIVDFASTISEHDGNRIAALVRAILSGTDPVPSPDVGENWREFDSWSVTAQAAYLTGRFLAVLRTDRENGWEEGFSETILRKAQEPLRRAIEHWRTSPDVGEAIEALAPFAAVAEHDIGNDEDDSDWFRPMDGRNNRAPRLQVGDLRRAMRALASLRTDQTTKGE